MLDLFSFKVIVKETNSFGSKEYKNIIMIIIGLDINTNLKILNYSIKIKNYSIKICLLLYIYNQHIQLNVK